MNFTAILKKHSLCFSVAVLFGLGIQSLACAAQAVHTNAPQAATLPQQRIKTVVYYFHGNMRCSSCKKIEAYTREAIQSGFAEALKNGNLELKVINVEQSGNDHYVEDFQLYSRSVVLERRSGNKQQEWKNLDQVWSLIRDKTAFMQYIQEQTLAMIKGG